MKKRILALFFFLLLGIPPLLQVSCSRFTTGPYSPPLPVLTTPLPAPFTSTTTFSPTYTPTGPLATPTVTPTNSTTPTGTFPPTSTPVCVPWTAQGSLPDIRQGFGIAQTNGIIYVGGGYGPQKGGTAEMALSYLESYNPANNSWTELPSLLAPVENPACAAVNNILYFFGGDNGTAISGTVQGYVISSNSWGYGSYVGFTARTRASAAVLNGLIYVLGGYNTGVSGNQGGYLARVEAYDPATDSWNNSIPGLGVSAANVGAASLNGILYAFGGITQSGATNFMAAYNPATNSWTPKNNLPFSGGGEGAVVNGVLYAFSHATDSAYSAVPTAYAYHPASDSWSAQCPLLYEQAGFETTVVGNSVYAIGGSNNLLNPGLNEMDAF